MFERSQVKVMGMAKSALIGTLVLALLVATAGAAEAGSKEKSAKEKGSDSKEKEPDHGTESPPDHAKAKGRSKHATPPPAEPTPTEPVISPPVSHVPQPVGSAAPPTDPPSYDPAPVASAPVVATSSASAPTSAPIPDRSALSTLLRVPSPDPSIVESRVDRTFAAGAFAAGSVRAPGPANPIGAPPTDADGPRAPWWLALLWGAPVAGVGGVAAVLVARQRKRRALVQLAARGRMSPVSPDDVQGLLQNGQSAVARGAYEEAIAWFDRVVRIAPSIGVAHFCRGICLAASGRVAEAYGSLRSACEHEPADASYRIHFARAALALGKHKEAMDALEHVARAMPELGTAMLEDPQLAGLRDHPRFLMICGAL